MPENANKPHRTARGSLASALRALAFAAGFVARHPGAILRRVAVPVLLGCATLYVLIWGYCTQLASYLDFPSDGLAGRVMGIAAVSVLIMLFLHAIVVARVAELVMGCKNGEQAFLGIPTDAWRIYVANLRLLLALGVFGVVGLGSSSLMFRLGVAPDIEAAFSVAAWLLLLWLLARCWFFLMPISLQAHGESGIVTSWRLSRGHLWAVSIVMLALMALMVLLLGGGEFLLRSAGVLSPMPRTLTFVNAIGLYQRNLWPFVILVSAVYLCVACLMTAARIGLHRELVTGKAFAAPAA
jgi:hypothetical protein